jgi:hypothetical protein
MWYTCCKRPSQGETKYRNKRVTGTIISTTHFNNPPENSNQTLIIHSLYLTQQRSLIKAFIHGIKEFPLSWSNMHLGVLVPSLLFCCLAGYIVGRTLSTSVLWGCLGFRCASSLSTFLMACWIYCWVDIVHTCFMGVSWFLSRVAIWDTPAPRSFFGVLHCQVWRLHIWQSYPW